MRTTYYTPDEKKAYCVGKFDLIVLSVQVFGNVLDTLDDVFGQGEGQSSGVYFLLEEMNENL